MKSDNKRYLLSQYLTMAALSESMNFLPYGSPERGKVERTLYKTKIDIKKKRRRRMVIVSRRKNRRN